MPELDRDYSSIIEQLRQPVTGAQTSNHPPLKPPTAGGTSRGIDPWQQSVEKRLDSLDGRAQRLEATAGEIKVDVAVLKERVTHLPTKGWMIGALLSALAVIAGLTAFAEKIQHLVG